MLSGFGNIFLPSLPPSSLSYLQQAFGNQNATGKKDFPAKGDISSQCSQSNFYAVRANFPHQLMVAAFNALRCRKGEKGPGPIIPSTTKLTIRDGENSTKKVQRNNRIHKRLLQCHVRRRQIYGWITISIFRCLGKRRAIWVQWHCAGQKQAQPLPYVQSKKLR